jgi:hypothetical protein
VQGHLPGDDLLQQQSQQRPKKRVGEHCVTALQSL